MSQWKLTTCKFYLRKIVFNATCVFIANNQDIDSQSARQDRSRKISRPEARIYIIESVQKANEDVEEDQSLINYYQRGTSQGVYSANIPVALNRRLNGVPVTILLDCESVANVVRPGLATKVFNKQREQLKQFDGSLTNSAELSTVEANFDTSEGDFSEMLVSESRLDAEHDLIFGLTWFRKHKP